MRHKLICLSALALAGCATPVIKERIVEVKIPISVQPITPGQVPLAPPPLGPRPKSLSAAADLLMSKWCEAVAYMTVADPLLRISSGQKSGPVLDYPECQKR